jgi:caffeoyl-CoA O-methyltransferase
VFYTASERGHQQQAIMTNKNIILDEQLYPYFRGIAYDEAPILAALREHTARLSQSNMQISPEQGAFMALLVKIMGAKRILEFGTFTGYSSLAMALALPPGGHIIASDVSDEWTKIAREFWTRAGVADRISLSLKPGREVIADLLTKGEAGSFDMMFIDADKENYHHYYESGLQLLRPGGLMLIDNVLWGGDVAKPEKTDEETVALRNLNAKIRQDQRVDFCMLPLADGLTLARKR